MARSRPVLRVLLPFALGACVGACGPTANEKVGSNASRIEGTTLGSVRITNYTLAREAALQGGGMIAASSLSSAHTADFLCSGKGVAMQGTGVGDDGRFVKYVSGGGGWCGNYARLCNCGSARFAEVDSVFGSTGRTLTKDFSIAVDPKTIPHGRSVWIAALGRWFRADDSGGAIVGRHIDVYTQDDNPGYYFDSTIVVSNIAHEAGDPGPNGEPGGGGAASGGEPAPEPVIEDRPEGGPFHALEVRYPVGEGGWITQCTEAGDEEVWRTRAGGRDAYSRWAEAKYPQVPADSCGDPRDGKHPLVFRSEAGGSLGGTWIGTCAGADHVANVFQVDGDIDGHPAAPFHHSEIDESCP
jgi:3D (Asp-Asp-Asp) domain-containing protein